VLIESAVRFRLTGFEEGSVVSVLTLPDLQSSEDTLELDVESLGEVALTHTLDVAGGERTERDVAEALTDWADEVGIGTRYDSVEFETSEGGVTRRSIRLDGQAVDRLREMAARLEPTARDEILTGFLFEADFERDTAHLRTPEGDRVAVAFDEAMRDRIHRALRSRASLVGEVQYDSATARAMSIRLREITRPEQLRMDLAPESFFAREDTVAALRHAGEPAGDDLGRVQDPDAPDEDVDAFLAAVSDL
jgi:hypothetical protein